MAHYAKVEDGLVTQVLVVEESQFDWLTETLGGVWVQTSYNTKGGVHYDPETGEPSEDQTKALRKNYAGVGFSYDAERDAFIPQKYYESWVLHEDTCLWVAPIAYPEDGADYVWDEEAGNWSEVTGQ